MGRESSRQDWIDAAVDALGDEPMDQLRVQALAKVVGVSRSSFYWYFESPDELRVELLTLWERNTASIVEQASRDSATIAAACLGVFECWADSTLYSPTLDLSVRDWAQRNTAIAQRVAEADQTRLDAIAAMFRRHCFGADEAMVRARLLYNSQVGYYTQQHALGTTEPTQSRMASVPHYIAAMTGTEATQQELDDFRHAVERRVHER